MTILQAIVLGIIQGITEFLPISSSGHLILLPELFGWQEQGLDFDIMVHVATLGAVIVMFLPEIEKVVRGMLRPFTKQKTDAFGKLGWMILVATIPAGLFGIFGADIIDSARTPSVVIGSLAFWGIMLTIADVMTRNKNFIKKIESIGFARAILIGVAQAVALIPGTSRSGITITAGLFSGLDRDTCVRFSFLLGIPAIAGAGLLSLKDFLAGNTSIDLLPLSIGFLAAFLSGLFAIKILLALAKRANFAFFGVYRIILAVIAWFIIF